MPSFRTSGTPLSWPLRAQCVFAATVLIATVLAHRPSACAQEGFGPQAPVGESSASSQAHHWYFEGALFPTFTQQQIEGPNRDDRVVNQAGLGLLASATYAFVHFFEAGLYFHFDVGSSEHTLYSRPDEAGLTTPTARVEGSHWEWWTVLLARFRWGPAFFELGWAPLILRHDSTREDLPNTFGETDGDFLGSRSVAFLLGVGGAVPLTDSLDLTLRLQARIRYLVGRGSEPLADDEEFGQMAFWPFVGLAYHL